MADLRTLTEPQKRALDLALNKLVALGREARDFKVGTMLKAVIDRANALATSTAALIATLSPTRASQITVVDGVLTVSQTHHLVAPESGSFDVVTSIEGLEVGAIVILRPVSGAAIVFRHDPAILDMRPGGDQLAQANASVQHFMRTSSTSWVAFSARGDQTAHAAFDPSFNTSQRAIGAHGLGVFLPAGAIITRSWYVVTTALASTTDVGEVALGVPVDGSGSGIVPSTAMSTMGSWNLGAHDGLQVGTAVAFHPTLTDDRELTATVSVEALTAGRLMLYVQWTSDVEGHGT